MSAAAESLTPTKARPTVSTRRILGTTLGAHVLHDHFDHALHQGAFDGVHWLVVGG